MIFTYFQTPRKRMVVTMETTVNKPCVIANLLSQKGLKPSVFTLELSIEFAFFYPLVYFFMKRDSILYTQYFSSFENVRSNSRTLFSLCNLI